jgi:hypothetical protein
MPKASSFATQKVTKMNVLFFLEPAIELGKPQFRYATLRNSFLPQIKAIEAAGHSTSLVVSQQIADRALQDGTA